MLAVLLLAAVAYVAVAPDRRTAAVSRGTAHAGRAAAVGAYRQARGDWQSGRPDRQKKYRTWRTRLAKEPWGQGLLVGWDVLRFGGRGIRATGRTTYRAGRAAVGSGRAAYRPAADAARQKRIQRRATRAERRQQRIERRLGLAPSSGVDILTATPDVPAGTTPAGPSPIDERTPVNFSLKPREWTTTSDLRGEAGDLKAAIGELRDALQHLRKHLDGMGDQYAGAPFGTEGLSRALSGLTERASTVDPAVADGLLEDVTALENALDEADRLAEQAAAIKAEGNVEAFQPA